MRVAWAGCHNAGDVETRWMGMRAVRPEVDAVFARLYEAAAIPEFWPDALQMMSDLMDSRGTLLTRADRNHVGLIHSPDIADSVAAFFEGGWQDHDLRTERTLRRGVVENFTCEQHIVTPEEMRRSDYYNGFAVPADVPWFASGGIITGEAILGVSFQRNARQGAFSETDQMKLNRILPRLQHVLSVAYRLAGGQEGAMIEDLAGLDNGVILLGPSGLELDCNARAESCFGNGLIRGVFGPTARDPDVNRALRRLIEAACGDTPCPTHTVLVPQTRGPTLQIQAVRLTGQSRDLFSKARALLIVTPATDDDDRARLQTMFDLTSAEARVAVLMLAGRDVATMADELSISREAVRFHLKSILPKAGVGRQAEFVLRATQRLADLP